MGSDEEDGIDSVSDNDDNGIFQEIIALSNELIAIFQNRF